MIDTPILLIGFNRPKELACVIDSLRVPKPSNIFIAFDGPRAGHAADAESVPLTRHQIELIDWPCTVKTLMREENQGCRKAVSGAIDWFFDQVEYGIVLEDDIIAQPSFFTFCADLLKRYATNERVMAVNGANFISGHYRSAESYFFDPYVSVWGWATWRRAWKKYDRAMVSWPQNRNREFFRTRGIHSEYIAQSFCRMFDTAFLNKVDTWDYMWVYTLMRDHALCATPNIRLIDNIGFSDQATHTKMEPGFMKFSKSGQLEYPLIHPPHLTIDRNAQALREKIQFGWSAKKLAKAWQNRLLANLRIGQDDPFVQNLIFEETTLPAP